MQNATQAGGGGGAGIETVVWFGFWLSYVGCIACVQAHHRGVAEKSLESEKQYSQWLQRQLRTHIDAHPTAYPPDPNVHHIVIPAGPGEEV
jgi:hypothetical protein